MALLTFTEQGIYCEQADVFIDPWNPVEKALITHGHGDHARWGHSWYLCTEAAAPVIRYRLGEPNLKTIPFSKPIKINGVKISFHPAGHIIGSAQIRLEYKGEVWVASGDYKLEPDGISEPFEPVKCQHFITESTFGLPVYKWQCQAETMAEINDWWRGNAAEGKTSVIGGYSLGKAQRIIQNVDHAIGPVFTHGAVENLNEVIRDQGVPLKPTTRVTVEHKKGSFAGALVVATPSATGSNWMRKFEPFSVALASGWMSLRGTRRRRTVDRGFVLSDHADWDGLITAINATEGEHIYVTHGYTDIFSRYLRESGWDASIVETEFEGELAEIGEGTADSEDSK